VVPGGPGGDHIAFKLPFSALRDRAQLVYLDHRGSGRSARSRPETCNLDNHVEDIEALRQHLGLDKIGLLGVSYGGMVSLTYATRYDHHLSHLILVVTAASHRFMTRAQEILAERGTAEQQAVAQRLWAGAFETQAQMREYFEVMGPLYSRKFDLAKEREQQPIFSPEAINAAYGDFLRNWDVVDDLHRISAPTLVIGARHDWITAPEFSTEIAQRIRGSDLRIFENSGHNVHVDEYDAFIDVVRGFLAYAPARVGGRQAVGGLDSENGGSASDEFAELQPRKMR